MSVYSMDKLIGEARRLAAEYRRATGKPLPGVSAEIAIYDATRLLELDPCPGVPGCDAVDRTGKRVQIKGRAIFDEVKGGQRIGQLNAGGSWDSVVLVLMDEDYEPLEIYEAERDVLVESLDTQAGSSRSRRGALSVARFKNIGLLVWDRFSGRQGGVWENRSAGESD